MSSPDEWNEFYEQNFASQAIPMFGDHHRVSEATTVTTTTAAAATSTNHLSSPGHLGAEGRVSKPIRRRSRASRRTPTTLLNTDTSNFRAMVQQFTGGPSALPFAMEPQFQLNHGSGGFSFRVGPRQAQGGTPNPQVLFPGGGYHVQYDQLHQQQNPTSQVNQQPFMFTLRNPVGNPRQTFNVEASVDEFPMEGTSGIVSSHQLKSSPTRPPASSSSENRGNNFFF